MIHPLDLNRVSRRESASVFALDRADLRPLLRFMEGFAFLFLASVVKSISPIVNTIKFKLTIAYDGTAYEGWQVQHTGTGVQQKVEDALARLFRSKPRVHSSSRTDTGVHALGMVAHFDVPKSDCRMSARKLSLALNAWLPEDIRVVSAARASSSFHARFHTEAKEYRYFVWNHAAMNPLIRHSAWHVPRKLDLKRMKRAAAAFVGKHDFQSFAANPGYRKESTVRTITRCSVKRNGPLLTFVIMGDGFLYKMCRGIAGTIVQIGLDKFPVAAVKEMLVKKDRRAAGMTAPAHGLVLWKVYYDRGSKSDASDESALPDSE